jgi:hypothetical protein
MARPGILYYDMDGNPLSMEEWSAYYGHNRHVGETYVRRRHKTYYVSTVWLGLDHGWGDGPPVIFETMVFERGDFSDLDMDRYATKEQAKAGHRRMVAAVRRWRVEPIVKSKQLIHKGGKP